MKTLSAGCGCDIQCAVEYAVVSQTTCAFNEDTKNAGI